MAEKHAVYENPLCRRYASREMQEIFSDDRKFSTWRRLWVALAESERELGLNITVEQIAELRAHVDDIDYDVADAREREVRHDVMAHIYAYGKVCPDARAIIHLGATSCYVGDNTDVLLQREALLRIRTLLLRTSRHWRISRRSMPICRRWRIRTSRRHSRPRSASAQRCGCRT